MAEFLQAVALDMDAEEGIDGEEFLLLQQLDAPRRTLHHSQPNWQYKRFDLEAMEDSKCLVEFRFSKNEIYQLINVFRFPESFTCYNGTVVDAVEALCIALKRYAYPCRYVDLVPKFGRPVPHLCMISNLVIIIMAVTLEEYDVGKLSRERVVRSLLCRAYHSGGTSVVGLQGFQQGWYCYCLPF